MPPPGGLPAPGRTVDDLAALTRALERSSTASALLGREATFTWANGAFYALLGRDAEDLRGLGWTDITHPADLGESLSSIRQLLDSAGSVRLRKRYVRPDGKIVWGATTLTCLVREDGRMQGVLAQVEDAGEQHDQEGALLESWARYNAVVRTMLDPFALLTSVRDEAGRIVDFVFVDINDPACQLHSTTRVQILGSRLLQVHPEAASTTVFDDYVTVVESGQPLVRDDWPYVDPYSGEGRRYDVRVVRVNDGVSLSWRDVTEVVESARRELRRTEARFQLMAENSADVVVLVSTEGRFRWVSPSLATALGWDAQEWLWQRFADVVHPEQRGLAERWVADVLAGDDHRSRWQVVGTDSATHWVDVTASPQRVDDGLVTGVVATLRVVDDDIAAEQALRSSQEQYRLLAEHASDIVMNVGQDDRVSWIAESVRRVLGWSPDDVVGHPAASFVHPDDLPQVQASRRYLRTASPALLECRVRTRDGGWRWLSLTVHAMDATAGLHRVIAARDIEEEVALRQLLADSTGRDQLTGLPTRASLAKDPMVPRSHGLGTGRRLGLLDVGVDNLSHVNEALSFASGDVVLRTLAARLSAVVGDAGVVARGAGVNFLVLIPSGPTAGELESLAARILECVRDGVEVPGGQVVTPTASIGAAVELVEDGLDELLNAAAIARRQAKALGRDRVSFADPALAEEARMRLVVADELRSGLVAGEVRAWYQPIVRLSDSSVVGYEALVRWHREDGTVMTPDRFLPYAEDLPLIADLDMAVLRQALHLLRHDPHPFMSVNVAARSLSDPAHLERITTAIAESGVRADRLHLEITETTLLGLTGPVLDTFRTLAAMGVQWYVDDFGTGYSSISHLRDLPIAGVKLDRSFTDGISRGDEKCVGLAQGLAGLAAGLGLATVAEGVERAEEAHLLDAQGWHLGQGWLYGRPSPSI